jgi:DNA polymerase-3 subunit delta
MPPLPPAVTVVVGAEEFLLAREVRRVLDAARAHEPTLEVTSVAGGDFTDEHVLALSSPDLFGGLRAMVITGAEDLSDQHREVLVAYARQPLPDVLVVLVQGAGAKGRSYPGRLEEAGATLTKVLAPTRPAERLQFLQDEIRAAGGQATAGAVRALGEAVGSDLRELSAVGRQLVADTGGLVDEAAVARFHVGRAETTGFAVADAAVTGQTAEALALLRSALETGTATVLLTSALASGLRDIARVREASGPPAAVARALGMPPWKVERSLRVARGWSEEGLSAAIAAVAIADAGVKGAAADPAFALVQAVLAVTNARNHGAREPGRAGRR